MKRIILVFVALAALQQLHAQIEPPKFSISGMMGVSYEGYKVTTDPLLPVFYTPRRPSNLLRFTFQPIISYGDFKLPFNINFSPMSHNYGSIPFGFGNLPGFPKQTFIQWLSNPINNIGLNPSYKWAELQLGTQYLKYSDLSTGDIATFGYGFSLSPGKLRLKYFNGISQQAYQPFISTAPPATFLGTYKRKIQMGQIGLGKEDNYFAGFNLVQSKDDPTSILNPMSASNGAPKPAENFIVTFVTKFNTEKGWYGQTEFGTTITTRDVTDPTINPLLDDFKPFISTNISSFRDHAIQAGFGKKGKDWDIGMTTKWLGAGYFSMGYPFSQNDRLEYTVNTRFNAWEKKINVVANIGQRFSNWSNVLNRTSQIIAYINLFTQFNDYLSLNANYNNYGFQTLGPLGIRNVGNDLGINPVFTGSTKNMNHLISLNYNWSKYDETAYSSTIITSNNSHTVLLLYVPTFFNASNLNTDISGMYFQNTVSPSMIKFSIITLGTSLGYNFQKPKISLRGQLQYNTILLYPNTANTNILGTLSLDWKLAKKLTWNSSLTINLFKYGNELVPPSYLLGAQYLENYLKTSLFYHFGN